MVLFLTCMTIHGILDQQRFALSRMKWVFKRSSELDLFFGMEPTADVVYFTYELLTAKSTPVHNSR
jgi:hypothetical protein